VGLFTDLSMDFSRRFGRPPQLAVSGHISRPKRVLVFPAQGDGEVLWALPALRALKKHFPDSLLSLMLDENRRSLWHFDGEVDEIIDYRPQLLKGRGSAEFKKLLSLIRSRRFDLLLNLNYLDSPLTDYLFYRSISGLKCGAFSKDGYPFKNVMIRQDNLPRDEARRNLAMLGFLGLEAAGHPIVWPRLVDAEGRREFKERLRVEGLQKGQQLIALDAAAFKRQSLEGFLHQAQKHASLKLMLINSGPELQAACPAGAVLLNSLATVELADALSFAKAFIGVKNDLFSLAYLLKVPCLISARQGERGMPEEGESLQIVSFKHKPEFPQSHALKMLEALA
jgi:ADP-heptose:LPS heptosyltransferase